MDSGKPPLSASVKGTSSSSLGSSAGSSGSAERPRRRAPTPPDSSTSDATTTVRTRVVRRASDAPLPPSRISSLLYGPGKTLNHAATSPGSFEPLATSGQPTSAFEAVKKKKRSTTPPSSAEQKVVDKKRSTTSPSIVVGRTGSGTIMEIATPGPRSASRAKGKEPMALESGAKSLPSSVSRSTKTGQVPLVVVPGTVGVQSVSSGAGLSLGRSRSPFATIGTGPSSAPIPPAAVVSAALLASSKPASTQTPGKLTHRVTVPTKLRQFYSLDSSSAISSAVGTGLDSPTGSGKALRPPVPLPARPSTPQNQISVASQPGTPDSAKTAVNAPKRADSKPVSPTPPLTYPVSAPSKQSAARLKRWRFWNTFRATLAVLLAAGIIAAISYRIAMMHRQAGIENAGFTLPTNCSVVPPGYPASLAILEPSGNLPLFGFQMDWAIDTPTLLSRRVGRRPAIYGAWLHIDANGWDREMMDWYPKELVAQAMEEGGDPSLLMITLLPNVTMEELPQGWEAEFAEACARINARGVGVLLRFAHEMNGPWHPYGQYPLSYIRTFRRLAEEIRKRTRMTGMMWAPNAGNCGYPWVGAFEDNYYDVQRGDEEKEALDTNQDGRISVLDDPYTPYYPGDGYVDWIGLSVYHYSIPAPENSPPLSPGTNTIPRPGLARALITGDDLCGSELPVWSISRMAEERGKPLAVPETGAVFYTEGNEGGVAEEDVKAGWWRQVLELGGVGGIGVKMVLWFEEDKVEPDRGNVTYAVTHSPTLRRSFLRDLNNRTMVWGDQVKPWCGGGLGDGVPWSLG